ncbi:late competence development ComFB family protein [Sporomusa sphaeroides]|uniref:Late competence development protein ComFB n=1 Tax=Sporomusa sphaeroides DSM 2875 TaxID=1337886 RepID=A0ABP2C2U2_9FIRM|nr:late competence development ComFB family protein [Sporomusa sphaeroides]OLS58012.1 late competence development protein ComFB [Sporomusa sphaeroides DSM 2875]CVK17801.1 Late competence development protein ComFB [Sporomusa sphaeroides DSM 2875]
MELKNFMEDLVWQQLDEVIENHKHACRCEQCRFDTAALALNLLPPHYVVSARGETFSKAKSLEQQFNVDILTAISQAIQIVSSRPRHESKKA